MSNRRVFLVLALVGVLAPLLAILVGILPVGETLERRVYDGWFRRRGPLPKPVDVVVVAIDVESEESLGRYPWSRDWHSQLIRNLARAGAKVVAFDATFADEFPVQDTVLRRVIDSTGIAILGAKTTVISNRNASGGGLEVPAGVLGGVPIGIVDNLVDPVDGVIREYAIRHEYPQGPVPQLGVGAVLRFLDLPIDSLVTTPDGWRIGAREVPRGVGEGMLIDFLGRKGSVTTYSYASVVDDAATDLGEWDMDEFDLLEEEGRFRDKIVLVGSTVEEHQDTHTTPFSNVEGQTAAELTPGVEIHAHAVQTILDGTAIRLLPRRIQYLWTILLGLLVVAFAPRTRGFWGMIAAFTLIALALVTSWTLFSQQGVWLWAATPMMAIGFSYAGSAATLFLAEKEEKARIRGMFQQYVASSVVDELIKHPELLALGGEERVLSVMFSDVADFSTLSEKLTPSALVALLNEYLTAMTDIVIKHGGIIDKYQGDCIMAEFGAPLPLEDHAVRSCRAALEMVAELGRLREKWKEEGKPQLHARVGINTGRVLVGNLGSKHFVDYTVMGDHVNLASRLEGANKPYGTRIMVSEFTWEEVKGEMYGRELDRIRVKGKDVPVCVYEVMGRTVEGIPPATVDLLAGFADAFALYREARFEEALAAFRAVAERHPDDGPTALYAERCKEYLAEPPPPGWDGVYTMKTK